LYDVIIRSHTPIFRLAVFLDYRAEYAFLEPLIELLVQKLGQKQLIGKGLFSILLGDFPNKFYVFLALISEPGTLKTRSDPSKSRIVTKKQLNSKKFYVI